MTGPDALSVIAGLFGLPAAVLALVAVEGLALKLIDRRRRP
jgi:hypothetical protein